MSESNRTRERRGFAMLTALWVMSMATVIAMTAALTGRHAVTSGTYRVELERGRWSALGCARRAEAAIDETLASAPTLDDAAQAWRTLGQRVAASTLVRAGCDVTIEAAGTQLDVNNASNEMIVNLLGALGLQDRAPEMADALADWMDADDEPRSAGAERSWYESQRRFVPRNGPLADIRELRRIRGFETLVGLDSVLGTEPGRVSLASAPVSVLLAVPGVTRETAERIVALQMAGTPPSDLLTVTGSISEASSEALMARYPDAARATTADPDAWIIRSRVSSGFPAVSVLLQWRVIRTGRRCVVTDTRSAL